MRRSWCRCWTRRSSIVVSGFIVRRVHGYRTYDTYGDQSRARQSSDDGAKTRATRSTVVDTAVDAPRVVHTSPDSGGRIAGFRERLPRLPPLAVRPTAAAAHSAVTAIVCKEIEQTQAAANDGGGLRWN